ncbi:uncharacterized protein Dyak_GE28236 [Drosophila yakuba]|uniref:BPTI/Kunitz inhibitor domain-containing protein n=1 Tax=Drosophila yakuba TaxID=7245 RepID=A0A0R1E7L4_DROYA|nr:uncharacterized protein Dyak_GE28236 [Drosophila yakuba]
MNFLLVLVCFTLNVALANSQLLCRARISESNTFLVILRSGKPFSGNPTCFGPRNIGTPLGFACALRFMPLVWYFNGESRRCEPMPYLGCGGSNNRFCSLQDCRINCLQFKR